MVDGCWMQALSGSSNKAKFGELFKQIIPIIPYFAIGLFEVLLSALCNASSVLYNCHMDVHVWDFYTPFHIVADFPVNFLVRICCAGIMLHVEISVWEICKFEASTFLRSNWFNSLLSSLCFFFSSQNTMTQQCSFSNITKWKNYSAWSCYEW